MFRDCQIHSEDSESTFKIVRIFTNLRRDKITLSYDDSETMLQFAVSNVNLFYKTLPWNLYIFEIATMFSIVPV